MPTHLIRLVGMSALSVTMDDGPDWQVNTAGWQNRDAAKRRWCGRVERSVRLSQCLQWQARWQQSSQSLMKLLNSL